MDLIFNCPKCGQELEVDDSGAGQEIECPSCHDMISIPGPDGMPAAEKSAKGGWAEGSHASIMATSAAAKVEKHLKVPVRSVPSEKLIAKALVPLEVAARESDRHLRVKSIRHTDCVEVGHDRFDETVTNFLTKIGDVNLVSITPLSYTHIDISTQKILTDYGVLILYRG